MKTIKYKKCPSCNMLQNSPSFFNNISKKDGLSDVCKECDRISALKYSRTKKGLISHIYSTQKHSSKIRGHLNPKYSKTWFSEWILAQPLFAELYKNWAISGFSKNMRPSCDRISNLEPYTIDNIQLMTWGENKAKGYRDRKNGEDTRVSRGVLQLSKDGIEVAEYYSIAEAARITNSHRSAIVEVCRGNRFTTGGFAWKYKNITNRDK